MRSYSLIVLLLLSLAAAAQKHTLQYIDTKTNASFRGMSVGKGNAVWVSGSKGWVGHSASGGTNWQFGQVPGYEQCDFRTIYAFDSATAIIANAGSPAYILRTEDGGRSWQKVYELTDSAAFIDGIDFWNKERGIIYGDPINRRMLLLHTGNGGKKWTAGKRKGPEMKPGEASFAASGTNIKCLLRSSVVIAAGGKTSSIFLSRNSGRRWRSIPTPMLAGKESTGIFTIMAANSTWNWLIAGGDYKQDTLRTANFFYTHNKGKKWIAPTTTTRGYRECLTGIDTAKACKKDRLTAILAVGPTGIDISTDDGANWQALSNDRDLHVIKTAADHKRMYVAGGKGKLAILELTF